MEIIMRGYEPPALCEVCNEHLGSLVAETFAAGEVWICEPCLYGYRFDDDKSEEVEQYPEPSPQTGFVP